jgi:2-amino-4-hydroxy-6-hydroxymethyldihydropteridine diphosphokinase
MAHAFVSLGSNIEPETNIRAALHLLKEQVVILAISTVYLTEPIGHAEQSSFYNCVVSIGTDLPPREVKIVVLRRIENKLGRIRSNNKSAPRTIDLDLLLYENLVVNTGDLTLPDPDIRTRSFLAAPLYELAPDLVLPDSKESISAIAAKLPIADMKPLIDYTSRVQREILV